MKKAADDIKSVTLELGGKSPSIILEDADIEEAIEGSFDGTMYNHGQNCSACTREVVHREHYARVVTELADRAKSLKVGPGMDPAAALGTVASADPETTLLDHPEQDTA